MSARMHFVDDVTGVEFEWHGGEYIQVGQTAQQDIGPFNNLGQPSWEKGQFMAHDVINVWDYEKGEPRIDRSIVAFEQACREHLDGPDDDDNDED